MSSCTVLVACEALGGKLDAPRAARAIGRGLRAGEPTLQSDECPLETSPTRLPADFDARMRGARAVVIATGHLDHETLLRGAAVVEIATRARQAGVPCYAIAAGNALDAFEARILDLQVVLEAGEERGLSAAGKKLAQLL